MTLSVAGCFGSTDLIFAGHPSDEERAFKLLSECRHDNVGWSALEAELRKYLVSNKAGSSHINNQIEKAEKVMKPWLLD